MAYRIRHVLQPEDGLSSIGVHVVTYNPHKVPSLEHKKRICAGNVHLSTKHMGAVCETKALGRKSVANATFL